MPQPTTRARPAGHPGYSETLPRDPKSAATARRLVRTACTAWGLDRTAENGALVLAELVANAVRHARRQNIRVMVDRPKPDMVRVAVSDFSHVLPELCTPKDDEEGGRGLALVTGLATKWGTEKKPWGKIVWAELEGRR
ncbi:ATP-binding protein [Streptomyces sp. NPDC004682]